MLIGCSANEQSIPQKTNKEVSTENIQEMKTEKDLNKDIESEQKSVVTKLSSEELNSKMQQYEVKLREFLDSFPGGFYTADIKQFEHYKQNSKFKEYVDMLLDLGYGIEQAEGYYYLYVGEAVGYKDGPDAEEAITNKYNEELNSKMPQYEVKLHEFLDSFPGAFYTADIKQFEHYKQNSKFKEYVDMLLDLGYGIEQAEGYYYLYVEKQ